jgi:hypothetical protein
MRSSAKDRQMRSWQISSQQSNMLLFKLMDRKWGNREDSAKFSSVCSLQSWSRKGAQHGLVFPSPKHEAIDEESALPLEDAKELPDIVLPCRNTTKCFNRIPTFGTLIMKYFIFFYHLVIFVLTCAFRAVGDFHLKVHNGQSHKTKEVNDGNVTDSHSRWSRFSTRFPSKCKVVILGKTSIALSLSSCSTEISISLKLRCSSSKLLLNKQTNKQKISEM